MTRHVAYAHIHIYKSTYAYAHIQIYSQPRTIRIIAYTHPLLLCPLPPPPPAVRCSVLQSDFRTFPEGLWGEFRIIHLVFGVIFERSNSISKNHEPSSRGANGTNTGVPPARLCVCGGGESDFRAQKFNLQKRSPSSRGANGTNTSVPSACL